MNEYEAKILGSILLDNDSLYKIYDKLEPKMFTSETYSEAYREMLAMYDTGQKITVPSLAKRLESEKFDIQTISQWLGQCVVQTATSVEITAYAEILVDAWKSRSVKAFIQGKSFEPRDINETIADLMNYLETLQDGKQSTTKHIRDIVKEQSGNYFKPKDESGTILTGFNQLDNCLGSLEGGDVYVLGARPAVGKSAFVLQLIINVASKSHKVGYFNLEMSESQVYERSIASVADNLELIRIKRAINFLGDEEKNFNSANEKLSGYDIVVSTGSKSVSEIKAESRHQKFDLIVIDYLQLIRADRQSVNRATEVGYISKAIKALAMELNVPIVLLSQLNRTSESKETKEPTMAELRESGDIEQDASAIVLMWNLSESRKYKGIKVDKNRQGETNKWAMEFIGKRMTFEEIDGKLEDVADFARAQANASSPICSDDDTPF